jgi:hypothetical protein
MNQLFEVAFTVEPEEFSSLIPTGEVAISVETGSESCSGSLLEGYGSCSLMLSEPGEHTLRAEYSGDRFFEDSTNTEMHIVSKDESTTMITLDAPDPSVVGQVVEVGFTVAANRPVGGTPTGDVTVTVEGGTESCTATLENGVGSCSIALNNAGKQTLIATYHGDVNHKSSSSTDPHAVNKADTTTVITLNTPNSSAVGQAAEVGFTVAANEPGSGTPTGDVTITVEGGTGSCTATLENGVGSCSIVFNNAGEQTLIATYKGDMNFNTSSTIKTQSVHHAIYLPLALYSSTGN